MIAFILTIVITVVSLMVALFMGISQVFMITEQDLYNKAEDNAYLYALHIGQLEYRALKLRDSMTGEPVKLPPVEMGPLKVEERTGAVSSKKSFALVSANITMTRPLGAEVTNTDLKVKINIGKRQKK
jgi:hypothetical protein